MDAWNRTRLGDRGVLDAAGIESGEDRAGSEEGPAVRTHASVRIAHVRIDQGTIDQGHFCMIEWISPLD